MIRRQSPRFIQVPPASPLAHWPNRRYPFPYASLLPAASSSGCTEVRAHRGGLACPRALCGKSNHTEPAPRLITP